MAAVLHTNTIHKSAYCVIVTFYLVASPRTSCKLFCESVHEMFLWWSFPSSPPVDILSLVSLLSWNCSIVISMSLLKPSAFVTLISIDRRGASNYVVRIKETDKRKNAGAKLSINRPFTLRTSASVKSQIAFWPGTDKAVKGPDDMHTFPNYEKSPRRMKARSGGNAIVNALE